MASLSGFRASAGGWVMEVPAAAFRKDRDASQREEEDARTTARKAEMSVAARPMTSLGSRTYFLASGEALAPGYARGWLEDVYG